MADIGITAPPAISCRALSREYAATQALSDVSLDIRRGEIHALVGEKRARNSTHLGILSGRVTPSRGDVSVFGRPLPLGDPRRVRGLGIAAIYQELTIVPALSAVANAFLGRWVTRHSVLKDQMMREQFVGLCADLGVRIDADTRAGRLPVGEQQLVEIMRGLISEARILLLDEPTAALAEHEREALYAVLDRLRASGVTIVFVSHNLDEVLQLSDTITVLRNGRLVATESRSQWTKPRLVEAMLGKLLQEQLPRGTSTPGRTLLRAWDVTVPGAISGISVEVRAGEILGLAGLVGSGRTTLMRALAGLEPEATGQLQINDREMPWPRTTRAAMQAGIVLLPEDRKQGLVLGMPAADNVTLGHWRDVSRFGILRQKQQETITRRLAHRFGFDPGRTGERVGRLSGGNQQKILLAKSVHRNPVVLLADEPTRGIDVGAKAEVLKTLIHLAGSGLGLVIASSELEEVLAVSDRALVLHQGRSTVELNRGDPNWSIRGVLHEAFAVGAGHE